MNPPDDLITKITALAQEHDCRSAFNDAIKENFLHLGSGCFRAAYISKEHPEWVMKVRRLFPRRDSGFRQEAVETSNADERDNYELLKAKYPSLAAFVLPVHYFGLPNDHDVVFMQRATLYPKVWRVKRYDGTICAWAAHWHPKVRKQHAMVTDCFLDAHQDNIGIIGDPKLPTSRVYMIDINHGKVDMYGEDWMDGCEGRATKMLDYLQKPRKPRKAA